MSVVVYTPEQIPANAQDHRIYLLQMVPGQPITQVEVYGHAPGYVPGLTFFSLTNGRITADGNPPSYTLSSYRNFLPT